MSDADGVVRGMPGLLLRLEGAVLLGLAVLFYAQSHAGWGMFALLFLVPDVAMLGYLTNPRLGAAFYNAAHVTIGPAALGVLGLTMAPWAVPVALIWAAHIGFDRVVGYGLKYPDRFQHTHLGAGLGTPRDPG